MKKVITLEITRDLTDDEAACLENEVTRFLDLIGINEYSVEVEHEYKKCPLCGENDVTCSHCNHVFDWVAEPEVSMGYVLCPNCKWYVDQEGKAYR